MDKATSAPSPKLSASAVKSDSVSSTSFTEDELEKNWLVISGGEGYIDFRTGDNIEGGENIGGPEDIPSNSKMSSAENSHIMVWQVTGDWNRAKDRFICNVYDKFIGNFMSTWMTEYFNAYGIQREIDYFKF